MAKTKAPIFLDADDVERVLNPAACRAALQEAYRDLYAAPADRGQTVGFSANGGKFHVKAGLLPGSRRYFAAKINGNFPQNPYKNGLPSIQGLVALFDGQDGRPLTVLHSGVLTGLRTAGAAALAATYGARKDSRRLCLIGAGAQARFQLAAMAEAFSLREVSIFDLDRARAESFANFTRGLSSSAHARASGHPESGSPLSRGRAGEGPQSKTLLNVRVCGSVEEALADCDIAVTLTPSKEPFVRRGMLPKGCFLAALGADSAGKRELHADVFEGARIFADDRELCAHDGDLAHALAEGVARLEDVTELAALCAGAAPGRQTEDQIVVYDSTGAGVQDVAAAAAAYEAAVAAKLVAPYREG
jgi:ornithine cyclodeaminase/alanine dehydrogenase-like protein (mu-crystallin family)